MCPEWARFCLNDDRVFNGEFNCGNFLVCMEQSHDSQFIPTFSKLLPYHEFPATVGWALPSEPCRQLSKCSLISSYLIPLFTWAVWQSTRHRAPKFIATLVHAPTLSGAHVTLHFIIPAVFPASRYKVPGIWSSSRKFSGPSLMLLAWSKILYKRKFVYLKKWRKKSHSKANNENIFLRWKNLLVT